ncbi:MAG: hypothetical protein QM687_02360 [Ferruginibacter sp.]
MKVIIITILAAFTFTANAQRKTDSIAAQQKAVKTIVKNPKILQQPATPATQVNMTPPKTATQTATGMIYTPTTASTTTTTSTTQATSQPTQTTTTTNPAPAALPDVIVTDINFAPNTGNTYLVNYTLKNTGTAPVKKGLLSVQSYISGGAAGGAKTTTLGSEINQLLNPGESITSKHTFSTTGLVPNTPYPFMLCVNGMKVNAGTSSEAWVGQQFSELNYANNSLQNIFTIPPPPPAPADVSVVITSITKSPMDTASFVRIYYTLQNIGETAIPQNASLSIQTRVEDTDNNPATFLATACCGQPTGGGGLEANDIPFAPGAVKNLYYDARVAGGYYSSLPTNTSYNFNVEITNNGGFTDGNNANNKNSFVYFLK